MNWVSVKDQPMPYDVDILVTDGRDRTIMQISCYGDGHLSMHPVGFSGHEWDYDIYLEDITHWMLAPELPEKP